MDSELGYALDSRRARGKDVHGTLRGGKTTNERTLLQWSHTCTGACTGVHALHIQSYDYTNN